MFTKYHAAVPWCNTRNAGTFHGLPMTSLHTFLQHGHGFTRKQVWLWAFFVLFSFFSGFVFCCFYCESGHTLENVSQRLLPLHLWWHSKSDWTWFWATCCGWFCLSTGVGLDDFKRLCPTSTVLWFCDSCMWLVCIFKNWF